MKNIKDSKQMNSVNLKELNKRIKNQCPFINSRENNKRDFSYILKETQPDENINMVNVNTLSDNLNDLIKNNSKLNPNSNQENNELKIIYKKTENNNISNGNILPLNNNKNNNPEQKIDALEKNIINIPDDLKSNNFSPKNNSNILNQKNLIENNCNLSPNQNLNNTNNNISQANSINFLKFNNRTPVNLNNTKNCVSLIIDKNIPGTLVEFGKYLIKYIEKEENYRILLEKELKKIKEKIKKIFDKNNQSDHCLLEYMIELWDKLEVSYSNRYKIFMDLCKK